MKTKVDKSVIVMTTKFSEGGKLTHELKTNIFPSKGGVLALLELNWKSIITIEDDNSVITYKFKRTEQ